MNDDKVLKYGMNRNQSILLLIIILISLLLRIHNVSNESIWLDEGFSISIAKLSVPEIFLLPETNPPLYYIILHWWMGLFGDSEFSIRLPSVIFGFASIFMMYKLANKFFDKEAGILSALLLGLSVFHIQYSQEARTYTLSALLTLLSMYYFTKLLSSSNYKTSIGYILSSILLMYSHVYGSFIIISQNICLISLFLLSRQSCRLKLKSWIGIQLILFILFLPWITIFISQALKVQAGYWIPKPSRKTIIDSFVVFSGNESIYLLLLLLIIVSPLSIKKSDQTGRNVEWRNYFRYFESYRWEVGMVTIDKIYVLFIWLLTPIVLPFVISRFSSPIYVHRYTIVASLAFYLLAAKGISNINHKYIKLIIIIAITASSFVSIWQYHTSNHKEQWRDVAHYIDTNANKGDLLLFNSGFQDFTFNYYSERNYLIKKSFPEETRYVNEENITELIPTVEGYKRVWIILSHSRDKKNLITKKLSEIYNLSYFKKYRGIKVYLFESRRSSATFDSIS